jgi:hypothetical protein
VWTVAGGQNGVLTSIARQLSRSGVYNGCVASGQDLGSGAVVSALVVDNNPKSATYWNGPFGQVPQFVSSSQITTTQQAQQVATTQMQLSTGLPYNLDFNMVPNPAVEPLDCIAVTYQTGTEIHVLDKVVLPLDAATAEQAVTRQQYLGVYQ